MSNVEIYTKDYCPYCKRAKAELEARGVRFAEIDVTHDAIRELEMVQRSGRHTVPQIFIDDYHVGGSDDLQEAARTGFLDRLLQRRRESAA